MDKRFKEIEKESEILKSAAKSLGHIPEYKSSGHMCDEFVCSCGWKSGGYWDGAEFAYGEWEKHAKEVIKSGQANLKFN